MYKKILALAMSLLIAASAGAQLPVCAVVENQNSTVETTMAERVAQGAAAATATPKQPRVSITLDGVTATSATFTYIKNDSTFAYLVMYGEPGRLDTWAANGYSNWQIFEHFFNLNEVALYRRDTVTETWTGLLPGDTIVAYVLALADAYDREGAVYMLGARTEEASGEVGVAEVALSIYNITDTSCDLSTEMNEHTDHYYFAYGVAAGYANYTESQIHEAILSQTQPVTENLDVILPELAPQTTYRVFILPFNIYSQMGTTIARDFTTGEISVATAGGVQFRIYPNPATSVLQVQGDEVERVELYNMLGQRVMFSKGTVATCLDVRSLAQGTYILKVYSHGRVGTQTLVVK